MSDWQLAEDRETLDALDVAVAVFKATLRGWDREARFSAREDVERAMLACIFRAAAARREARAEWR